MRKGHRAPSLEATHPLIGFSIKMFSNILTYPLFLVLCSMNCPRPCQKTLGSGKAELGRPQPRLPRPFLLRKYETKLSTKSANDVFVTRFACSCAAGSSDIWHLCCCAPAPGGTTDRARATPTLALLAGEI